MKALARPCTPVVILDPASFTPFYDVNLATGLAGLGWEVEWITSRWELEDVSVPGEVRATHAFFGALQKPSLVRVLARPGSAPLRRILKGGLYPADALALVRKLRARRAGILHVQWSVLPWLDSHLWAELQRVGWTVVYTAHDPRPLAGTTGRILGAASRALLRRADAVLVHDENARSCVREAGVDEDRLHVVAPGVPVASESIRPARADARARLGLGDAGPLVLFFGFVKPYKGLRILLESMALLRVEHSDVVLLIAGEIQEKRESYDRTIERLGVAPSIRWMGGYVPSGELGAYLAAADVVALPYLDASSSGVLLLAYEHARPVVATTVGGLPELVEPGASGLLVPPGDPRALARALGELLADPERAARMGERGRRLTRERHSWDRIAAEHARIYCEVADHVGRSRLRGQRVSLHQRLV